MYGGDDPMVPPGPKPRMVQKEMVIDEYHLSQVFLCVAGVGGEGAHAGVVGMKVLLLTGCYFWWPGGVVVGNVVAVVDSVESVYFR